MHASKQAQTVKPPRALRRAPRAPARFLPHAVLTACVASLALVLSTPAAAAPDPARLLMQPAPDAQYIAGRYFLVRQPYAAVKAALQQGFATPGLRGFQTRDDTAALSAMEFYWVQVSASHRPDFRAALSQATVKQATPTLDRALASGVVTPAERTAFGNALAQPPERIDDALKQMPILSQPVARWSFHRVRGSSPIQSDYGTVMDVSAMTGDTPMTLIWFSGSATTVTRRLRMTSCMTGVTCFPDPHIERDEHATDHDDPALANFLGKLARSMQALPQADAARVMQAYFDAYASNYPRPAPTIAQSDAIPRTTLPGIDLPADETDLRRYDNDDWRLLALPDGSLLASGKISHRYLPDGASVRRQVAAGLNGAQGLKITPDGLVWALDGREGGTQKLLAWRAAANRSTVYPVADAPDLFVDDWTLPASGGVALRYQDRLFSMTQQGQWSRHKWDASTRGAVGEILEPVSPRAYSPGVHFGDGLFWAADYDLYGIDPATARVARSIPVSTENLFFGSHAGHWAVATGTDAKGFSDFRVVDLDTGRVRADLSTPAANYLSSLARSAHGRLLALGSMGSVVVFDMTHVTPVLNLAMPANYSVDALAFSWAGDKLWIYTHDQGNDSPSKLIAWDVPAGSIDAARGRDIPDQLRCGDWLIRCR
ncbi:YncE family protein [Burkholderia stagnalis]